MSFKLSITNIFQTHNPQLNSEPASQKSRGDGGSSNNARSRTPEGMYPLGMVLDACSDLPDYAKTGISNWRDFLATVAVVRTMLGISPSAWEEAQSVMGEVHAAIVVAAILQRSEAIRSAGGYLRGLTEKARVGEFSAGPMLMALIGNKRREKKRA